MNIAPIKFLKIFLQLYSFKSMIEKLEEEKEKLWKFGTKAVHSGQTPDPISGAIITPIVFQKKN
jgi:hypothetical protein